MIRRKRVIRSQLNVTSTGRVAMRNDIVVAKVENIRETNGTTQMSEPPDFRNYEPRRDEDTSINSMDIMPNLRTNGERRLENAILNSSGVMGVFGMYADTTIEETISGMNQLSSSVKYTRYNYDVTRDPYEFISASIYQYLCDYTNETRRHDYNRSGIGRIVANLQEIERLSRNRSYEDYDFDYDELYVIASVAAKQNRNRTMKQIISDTRYYTSEVKFVVNLEIETPSCITKSFINELRSINSEYLLVIISCCVPMNMVLDTIGSYIDYFPYGFVFEFNSRN